MMLNEKPKEKYLHSFLIAFGVALLFFIPFLVADKGYFLFYGDFNVQQIPFYQRAHELVRSGALWDFGTDLGANFIGSYTFYLLGSPFFWLTLIFPNWMVPYLMGPLLVLKFACSSLAGYAYITRFVKNKDYALIGALLYAFSGFSVYNVFFNHFHEAIVFFPLLLLSMEKLMVDNKKGHFLLMVAVCAISNYFFFFGMVVFCVIYWIIRTVSGGYEPKLSRFGLLVLEAVLGLLISAVIMVPTAMVVLANSRIGSTISGWGGLLYGKEQIYAYIIESFFFPPELPARPVFFTGADVKWSSVAGWMPVFSMTGVIAWLISKKKTWERRVIIVMIIMAMVPVLNAAFYMFNYAYYARWFYMPILIMALVSAKGLEDETVDLKAGFRWTVGITLVTVLAVGFFPTGTDTGNMNEDYGLFDKSYDYRFWIWVLIALAGLVTLGLLFKVRKISLKSFARGAVCSICAFTVLYSAVFIGLGKSHSYESKHVINDQIQGSVSVPDMDSVRWDVYEGMDNTAMFLNVSSIQAFHSIVPVTVTEFYTYVGVERGVASRPETENYPLRSFLSVKYLLDYNEDSQDFADDYDDTQMPCYTYYDTQGNYDIYINDCYVPYGFTYDTYMNTTTVENFTDVRRQQLYLKAMQLTDEQIAKYGYLFEGEINDVLKKEAAAKKEEQEKEQAETEKNESLAQDPSADGGSSETPSDGSGSEGSGSSTDSEASEDASSDEFVDDYYQEDYYEDYITADLISFTRSQYISDCEARAASAAKETVFSKNGFTSKVSLEKDNLVFYSIPYEEGWSATVDGKPVKVEKVNVGFMAVLVPEGEHTVTFTYFTPGLKLGGLITLGSLIATVVYLFVARALTKKRSGETVTVGDPATDILTPDAARAIGLLSDPLPEELPETGLSDGSELLKGAFEPSGTVTDYTDEDAVTPPIELPEPEPEDTTEIYSSSAHEKQEESPDKRVSGDAPPAGFRLVVKNPQKKPESEEQ